MIKKLLLKVYNNWIRISDSIKVGAYTTRRTLKYTQRRRSEAEVLTSLSVSTHIVEKGLTMPQRHLGFGLPRISIMIDILLSNTQLKDEQQYQYAISVLKEYDILHKLQNFEIPEEIAISFTKLWPLFNGQIFSPQYKFTKDEFFSQKNADFPTFAHSRHSLRNLPKAAPVDDIIKAIELAKTAPSACNRQATKVHIYSDLHKVREILSLQNGNRGFGHLVKQILLITFDVSVLGLREQNDGFSNAGMFTMNLCFALHYYSIGSCILNWSVTAKKDKIMRSVANIPDNETIALVMIVGIPPKEFMVAKSERKETLKYYVVH